MLPEEELENLPRLLDRLRRQRMPAGWYRLYLKEVGFPRRKLVEFYKSGGTIGEQETERLRGSKPSLENREPQSEKPRSPQSAVPSGRHPVVQLESLEKPAEYESARRRPGVEASDSHDAEGASDEEVSSWSGGVARSLAGAAVMTAVGLRSG